MTEVKMTAKKITVDEKFLVKLIVYKMLLDGKSVDEMICCLYAFSN
jgi:hypothetical protein